MIGAAVAALRSLCQQGLLGVIACGIIVTTILNIVTYVPLYLCCGIRPW